MLSVKEVSRNAMLYIKIVSTGLAEEVAKNITNNTLKLYIKKTLE